MRYGKEHISKYCHTSLLYNNNDFTSLDRKNNFVTASNANISKRDAAAATIARDILEDKQEEAGHTIN